MKRTDFRGEGILTEKNMELLYHLKKNIVGTLFNINSLDEFLELFYEVFDSDNVLKNNIRIVVLIKMNK